MTDLAGMIDDLRQLQRIVAKHGAKLDIRAVVDQRVMMDIAQAYPDDGAPLLEANRIGKPWPAVEFGQVSLLTFWARPAFEQMSRAGGHDVSSASTGDALAYRYALAKAAIDKAFDDCVSGAFVDLAADLERDRTANPNGFIEAFRAKVAIASGAHGSATAELSELFGMVKR